MLPNRAVKGGGGGVEIKVLFCQKFLAFFLCFLSKNPFMQQDKKLPGKITPTPTNMYLKAKQCS